MPTANDEKIFLFSIQLTRQKTGTRIRCVGTAFGACYVEALNRIHARAGYVFPCWDMSIKCIESHEWLEEFNSGSCTIDKFSEVLR
jgi:hypothetical protein